MKILHIINGLNDGGAEAVLYRLITADTGAELKSEMCWPVIMPQTFEL